MSEKPGSVRRHHNRRMEIYGSHRDSGLGVLPCGFGRTVRLLTIAVSMCGTVTLISFHALNAQSDYQPHETIKDAQQDGRMDYIQGEFSTASKREKRTGRRT